MSNWIFKIQLNIRQVDYRIGQGTTIITWVSSTRGPMIFGDTLFLKNKVQKKETTHQGNGENIFFLKRLKNKEKWEKKNLVS